MDITPDSDADVMDKLPMEMKLRKMRDAAQRFRRQRLIEIAINKIEYTVKTLRVVVAAAHRPAHH